MPLEWPFKAGPKSKITSRAGIEGQRLAIATALMRPRSAMAQHVIHAVGIDPVGRFAGKAEDDGAVGAVALAGEGERAMQA